MEKVANNQVSVSGKTPDCNGIVWFVLNNNSSPLNVAPQTSFSFYDFALYPIYPLQVYRTKAHHPNLPFARSAQALQNEFNTTSEAHLAVDNDSCIPDSDPSLNDPATAIEDDVPVFAEFFITPTSPETFPQQFTAAKYLNIISFDDRNELLAAEFSQIKLVKSLPNNQAGVAAPDGSGNFILADSGVGLVLIHEWMHTNFLSHRGESGGNNPGTTTGANQLAVLYFQVWGGNEVNRFERGVLWF